MKKQSSEGIDAAIAQKIPVLLIDAAILHTLTSTREPMDVAPMASALGCNGSAAEHMLQIRLNDLAQRGKVELVVGEGWRAKVARRSRTKIDKPQDARSVPVNLLGGAVASVRIASTRAAVSLDVFREHYLRAMKYLREVGQDTTRRLDEFPDEVVVTPELRTFDLALQRLDSTLFDFLPCPPALRSDRFMVRMLSSAEAPGVPDRWTLAEIAPPPADAHL